MLCVVSALCLIEAQAYGGNANEHTRYGYVNLNGVDMWKASWYGEYPTYTGANVMIVDSSICILQERHHFDTFGEHDAGARLRDYLQGLSDGTVLVGVSCNSAEVHLSDAIPTLSALGADVSSVGFRGAWVFAAVKGDPSETVIDKQFTEAGEANARQPRISVTFGMCDLLQKITLS